ncbi:tetratricopeptide repeat protein [Granulicella sp. WH15]|uniref:tetratricopeptide repeat protein n=1 Tax=Granulicella sp. WH15 TaxID=2602070 RepID=UPI0013675C23|nr:tetratricopeptide repeat protein [Granulicella sp. WH15]QHN03973.1 tetratricopeptide repeat protein [Granulicella sp. WH15]
MTKPTISATSDLPPAMRLGAGPDRLDSWKEIASYLKREVRTVQMWEKKEGLPVHRHFHTHLGTVFAFRSEIEEWGKKQAAKQAGNKFDAVSPTEIDGNTIGRRVRIEVSPFRDLSIGSSYPVLCGMIVTETIAALKRLDQSKIEVLHSELTPGQPEKSSSDKPVADYQLVWDAKIESDGISIRASLMRNRTQSAVWCRTFPLCSGTGWDTPMLIADQIVQCLWLKIVSFTSSSLSAGRVEKTSSREAYLKGRYFWNRRDGESMRKAIVWFRTAIQEDPNFALPYSGLADSLTLLSFYEIVSPSEAMPEARSAALKAIELAPNLAEAHASLADIHLHFDRDWEGADQEYRRAIQCNPGYALGYHWYANLLAAKGQHEAANIAIMHALEIDPVSLITQVWAGVTSHLAHRFDDAIKYYQSALELDPNFTWAHMYMAQALEQKGRYSEALREFETTIRLAGGSSCVSAMKAHAHAVAGDKAAAREILRELRSTPGHKCMPSYDIAATYAALGDSSQTVSWLNRACSEHNMKLFKLRQDPRFDLIRHRPEFREVVEQTGLARYGALELR